MGEWLSFKNIKKKPDFFHHQDVFFLQKRLVLNDTVKFHDIAFLKKSQDVAKLF